MVLLQITKSIGTVSRLSLVRPLITSVASRGKATLPDLPYDYNALEPLEPAIRFNGGGHINHSIFWQNLSANGGEPSAELLAAIKADFGSLENMKAKVSALAIAVQGSGWAWLGVCPQSGRLRAVACPNQDPLEATTGLVPLFGIDVWEHAYYLQYKNVRPDYVNAIWKVANWKDVSARYQSGKPKN
ncbi:Superoxide dismutase [Mn], mitochondrial [Tyrophagus putrescentiae]|nr:Superoxide dismutase [Mn], mitochondrial [Tyrophagus putrescentiae]